MVFMVLPLLIYVAVLPFGLEAPPTMGTSMGLRGRLHLDIMDRSFDRSDLQVGDVIAFDDGKNLTKHRVVGIRPGPAYLTKGDGNDAPDKRPVTASNVRARRVATVPFLNALFGFILPDSHVRWLKFVPASSPCALLMVFWWRRETRKAGWRSPKTSMRSLAKFLVEPDWVAYSDALDRAYARTDLKPAKRLHLAQSLAAALPETGRPGDLERALVLHELVVAKSTVSDDLVVTGALISVRSAQADEVRDAIAELERVLAGTNAAVKRRARRVLREAKALLADTHAN